MSRITSINLVFLFSWLNLTLVVNPPVLVASPQTDSNDQLGAPSNASTGDSSAYLNQALVAAQQSPSVRVAISLNGGWGFTPQGGSKTTFNVPGAWIADNATFQITSQMQTNRLPILRGVYEATYERSFDIPSDFSEKQIILFFGAINHIADVYVNGNFIANHEGGFIPFELEITDKVNIPSSNNNLRVEIRFNNRLTTNGSPSGQVIQPVGWYGHIENLGISGDVELRAYPKVRIKDVYVKPSFRQKKIKLVIELENSNSSSRTVEIQNDIRRNGLLEKTLSPATVTISGRQTKTVTIEESWTDPVLWFPNQPQLYDLTTTLVESGVLVDSASTRFGFREVWTETKRLMMNGIRINLRGDSVTLFGQTEVRLYWDETPEAWRSIVNRMLSLGINVVRFHQSPPPEYALEICDDLGMMVVAESAIYSRNYLGSPADPKFVTNSLQWIAPWIRRDRNHPSIVMWSAENELLKYGGRLTDSDVFRFGQEILQYDDTRPIQYGGDEDLGGLVNTKNYHYIYDALSWPGDNNIYSLSDYADASKLNIAGEFAFVFGSDAQTVSNGLYHHGLLIRGYRFAEFADVRPYTLEWAWHPNPAYLNYIGVNPTNDQKTLLINSLAGMAVYDKAYDALGVQPSPPEYKGGATFNRTILIYNDDYQDENVKVIWQAQLAGTVVASDSLERRIPLGYKQEETISFVLPPSAQNQFMDLILTGRKSGQERFRDNRRFLVKAGGQLNPSLTVITPNGSEVVTVANTHSIQWSSTGTINQVKIEFSSDGGGNWATVVSSTPNDGSYNWVVPDSPSNNCLVRISDAADGNPSDVSDGTFSIVSSAGVSYALRYDGIDDQARILDNPLLSGGPGKSITVEAWVKLDRVSGHHQVAAKFLDTNWKDWGMEVEDGHIVVDIENNGDNWVYIAGSVPAGVWTHIAFTFDNSINIVRIYVNGSEAGSGASQNKDIPDTDASVLLGAHPYADAHWLEGVLDEVRIWNYARSASELQANMTRVLQGNESGLIGYWQFDEGSGQTSTDVTGNGNLVRLGSADGNDTADPAWVVSDAPVSSEPTLQVTSPNGGESWVVGSTHDITWTSTGALANVQLEFSTNNGGTWTTIVSSTENDGSYSWTIPDAVSDQSLVRVSDAADGDPSDVGNGVFSIVAPAPTLTLTSPNGGESWVVGSTHDITWTSTGALANVKLEFFSNNGGTWTTIVASTENDGSYSWTIPDAVSDQSLVRVSDAADGNPSDVSDGVFSIIAPPTITSFMPTSGPVGTEVTITGSHFTGATSVAFNATPATNFAVDSDTQIRAVVPEGATTGKISVTNAAGTGTSAEDFVVTTGGLITLTFNPTDDAYARSSSPLSNYGAATELRVRKTSSVEIYTYLKFNVSGLTSIVQSAKIRLYVIDAGNDGGTIYLVSNNYQGSSMVWTDAGLTWNNAPAVSGNPLSSAGSVTAGQIAEFDVTSAITSNRIYSFGIKNSSSDLVRYSSKEGSNLPELVIQASSDPSIAPAITSFTPTSGPVGTEVTITGSHFIGATSVAFNATPATNFAVDSDTQIRAVVPEGATTGKISVTNAAGTGTSAEDFVVTTGGLITLTFNPTDDAYARSSSPSSNYGAATELRVRKTSSVEIYTYLKFNVSGLTGTVQSAMIRLHVLDGGNDGGSIYSVSNNHRGSNTAWTEAGLNWSNAPAISGTPLSSAGAVTAGQTVELDVISAITGDGIYSFGIKNASSDLVRYSSKEGSTLPELIIKTTSGSISASKAADLAPDGSRPGEVNITTALPERIVLHPSYPNPFNAETKIVYELPQRSYVRLSLYDLMSHEIKVLANQEQEAGAYEVRWDGRDASGNLVPSGIYIYSLQVGSYRSSKKLMVLK